MKKAYKRKAKATWKTFLEVCGEQYEYGSKEWYEDQIQVTGDPDDHECGPWCLAIIDIDQLK